MEPTSTRINVEFRYDNLYWRVEFNCEFGGETIYYKRFIDAGWNIATYQMDTPTVLKKAKEALFKLSAKP